MIPPIMIRLLIKNRICLDKSVLLIQLRFLSLWDRNSYPLPSVHSFLHLFTSICINPTIFSSPNLYLHSSNLSNNIPNRFSFVSSSQCYSIPFSLSLTFGFYIFSRFLKILTHLPKLLPLPPHVLPQECHVCLWTIHFHGVWTLGRMSWCTLYI